MVKKDIFIRFGATHERDRRTDRHRVPAIAAICIALHGINHRAIGKLAPYDCYYDINQILNQAYSESLTNYSLRQCKQDMDLTIVFTE